MIAYLNIPQAFIESVIDIIRNEMRLLLVDGIKYQCIDGDMWCQEQLNQPNEQK